MTYAELFQNLCELSPKGYVSLAVETNRFDVAKTRWRAGFKGLYLEAPTSDLLWQKCQAAHAALIAADQTLAETSAAIETP